MTLSLKQVYSNGLMYLKTRVTTNQKHNRFTKTKKNSCIIFKNPSNQKSRKKKKQKKYKINWKTRSKIGINPYLSIFTLNVHEVNAQIKRQSGRLY